MPSQPYLNDWIRETSTTTGTGAITLLGAVSTFRTFASMYATNDTFFYTIKHRNVTEAESGIGQLTAGGTIARNTILESTNSNAAVSFSAGTKDVFIAPISTMFPTLADNEIWQGVTGSVPIATSTPSFSGITISGAMPGSVLFAGPGGLISQDNANFFWNDAANSLAVTGNATITSGATGTKPLIVKGFSGQTANLQEWQDSTSTTVASVTAAGKYLAGSGAVSAPSYSFLSFPNTGMYTNGAVLTFAFNGSGVFGISDAFSTLTTSLTITQPSASPSGRPLIVKGASGQTGDLQRWVDNTNAVLAFVSSSGGLKVASAILASAALTTTATSGFAYLPSCPGKPTGVPTAQTGTVPLVVDSTNSAKFIYSGGEWVCVGPTTTVLVFAIATGAAASVGANKSSEITAPFAGKILRARARAKTAPTGADLIFDINMNGTTIWSTQANRVKILAGATSGSQTTFNTTTFADGDVITVDVDQIGSGVAGSDVTVQLELRKTG